MVTFCEKEKRDIFQRYGVWGVGDNGPGKNGPDKNGLR